MFVSHYLPSHNQTNTTLNVSVDFVLLPTTWASRERSTVLSYTDLRVITSRIIQFSTRRCNHVQHGIQLEKD